MKLGFLALLGALLVLPTFALAEDGTQVDGDNGGAAIDSNSSTATGGVIVTGHTGNAGNEDAVGNVQAGSIPPIIIGPCDKVCGNF